ncbi:MAG TPA: hypothetical protein VIT41_12470 [Microlunatus sp.]
MPQKKTGSGRGSRPPLEMLPGLDVENDVPDEAGDLALIETLHQGLRTGQPLDFLAMTSGLVAALDPRTADQFGGIEHDDRPEHGDRPELGDLVDSFIGSPRRETTAALTVFRALVTDQQMTTRINRELARRRHRLPRWLTALSEARAEPDVWRLSDALGDGDDYLVGATLPSGDQLSALVYVDHNQRTVVSDAVVAPESVAVLVEEITSQITDDQSLTRVDAATARAIMEEAIELSARTVPPPESDSWPMARPLVEWLLRLLPDGGSVPVRAGWSEKQLAALTEDFFASRFGVGLDDGERRGLLESVLWFGTDDRPGDPLRWSEVNVAILLLEWVPRTIVAEPSYLSLLPDLLRAFIRYAHDRQGVPSQLTAEVVAAVDEAEPAYLQLIAGGPEGAAALLAQLLDANGGELPEDLVSGLGGAVPTYGGAGLEIVLADVSLEQLDAEVGGRDRLLGLTDEPLPDEPFAWDGILDDIRPVVEQMLAACDACADELLDVEHRTAMRRFLGRAAVAEPAIFRRKASPVRGAAAVAWVICRANGSVDDWESPLTEQDLLFWFGVKGSVSSRAGTLLRANGVDPEVRSGEMALGTPDLLVSTRRADTIEARDRLLSEA